MNKLCKKCLQTLGLQDFYVHKEMLDGHLNICKKCSRKYSKQYRKKNREEINRKQRLTGRTDEYKKARRVYQKKYNKKKRAACSEREREWIKKNPEKKRARDLVYYAIKTGKIKRGRCAKCGAKKTYAAHNDYSKPLEVVWLCPTHWGVGNRKYKD